MSKQPTEKKQYERPRFQRLKGFDFASPSYDNKGNRVACHQCANCHGCR